MLIRERNTYCSSPSILFIVYLLATISYGVTSNNFSLCLQEKLSVCISLFIYSRVNHNYIVRSNKFLGEGTNQSAGGAKAPSCPP